MNQREWRTIYLQSPLYRFSFFKMYNLSCNRLPVRKILSYVNMLTCVLPVVASLRFVESGIIRHKAAIVFYSLDIELSHYTKNDMHLEPKYSVIREDPVTWVLVWHGSYCVINMITWKTLRPRENGHRFADDTFKRIFLNEHVRISIRFSLGFVPKSPINHNPALVQIMVWRRSGHKSLSEPMMARLPTHICVTRPEWVNFFMVNTPGMQCIFYFYLCFQAHFVISSTPSDLGSLLLKEINKITAWISNDIHCCSVCGAYNHSSMP